MLTFSSTKKKTDHTEQLQRIELRKSVAECLRKMTELKTNRLDLLCMESWTLLFST